MSPYEFREALGYRDPRRGAIGFRRNDSHVDALQRTSLVAGTLDADTVIGTFQAAFMRSQGNVVNVGDDGRARFFRVAEPVLPRNAQWLLDHDETRRALSLTVTTPRDSRARPTPQEIEGFDRFWFGFAVATMNTVDRYLPGEIDVTVYHNTDRPLADWYNQAGVVELTGFDIGPKPVAVWRRQCASIVNAMRNSPLWSARD